MSEQRRARVEQLCVGVEQRWQGLRSVTPSQRFQMGSKLGAEVVLWSRVLGMFARGAEKCGSPDISGFQHNMQ